MNKASPGMLSDNLHWKAHMSVAAWRRAYSAMAAMWLHGGRGHANLYPRIDTCS
jgi:hypothetical protein